MGNGALLLPVGPDERDRFAFGDGWMLVVKFSKNLIFCNFSCCVGLVRVCWTKSILSKL